ncbi:MAG: hypothetical protein NVSMB16_12860 [Acidimicrobiales bacterium]
MTERQRRTSRRAMAAAGIVAMALIAAACSSGSSAAKSSSSAGGSSSTPTSAGAAGGNLGLDPKNPKLYHGPAGFDLDLSKCPADYNPTQGITKDKITVAMSLPKSGPLQGFGLIADGMNSYFKYLNDKGGVAGRKIELLFKDDSYEPARTKANVDDYVSGGNVAAFTTILGTPHNLAVWDKLNELCFPQLFTSSGSPQFGDVEGHPWTTGSILDYFTAAKIWAQYLKERFPNGTTVAMLSYNSDFGKAYVKGFKAAIKGSNIKLVAEQTNEQTDPNVKAQITTLAATKAEVFIAGTTGTFCTDAMRQVAQSGWKPLEIISETCSSISQFFKPLNPATATDPHPGEGVLLISYLKDVNDAAFANDPAVKLFKDTVSAQGLDPKQTTLATGWFYAEMLEKDVERAATLNGGLTRPNMMIAARSLNFTPLFALPGLKAITNGNDDAYISEGGIMKKFTYNGGNPAYVDADGAKLINLEGQTGNYAKVLAAAG